MKGRRKYLNPITWLAVAIMAVMSSCLHNDIPYPRILVTFASIEAEGQDRGALIDSMSLTVTLYLPEQVDPTAVRISDYTLNPPEATVAYNRLDEPLDLTKPAYVTLTLYQDYQWTIKAQQPIERWLAVEGQVGSPTIDVPGRRVVCAVSDRMDLKAIHVESIKLGPEGSTMVPNLEGQTVDFTHPVEVVVTSFGRESIWTIYMVPTAATVNTTAADAWTCVAWVYGEAEAGKDNGVEYRIKGDETWTRAPKDWITTEGGSFHARLIHLSPQTTYQARAYSDSEVGQALEFTTGSNWQMPNSNFDSWWLNGKVWNPWPEDGTSFWDTGNKGATTLGTSNSMPTDVTVSGTGWAAKLETRFVGIGVIGKLAAGNIFAGSFVRTDGTNGILSMGRPCTERPTALRGYLQYETAPINYASGSFAPMKGQPDTCVVWIALIDSPEPFEIRTNPNNRQLFDPDGPEVIAYGRLQYGETIPNYIPFEVPLVYKSTARKPRYILVTASASKYGDYFVGGSGAVLLVDDFELVYDY